MTKQPFWERKKKKKKVESISLVEMLISLVRIICLLLQFLVYYFLTVSWKNVVYYTELDVKESWKTDFRFALGGQSREQSSLCSTSDSRRLGSASAHTASWLGCNRCHWWYSLICFSWNANLSFSRGRSHSDSFSILQDVLELLFFSAALSGFIFYNTKLNRLFEVLTGSVFVYWASTHKVSEARWGWPRLLILFPGQPY